MTRTRREFLLGSAAVVATGVVGGATTGAEGSAAPGATAGAEAAGPRSEALLKSDPDHPKPAIFDRLDETWHRGAIRRLQARLEPEGHQAPWVALGDHTMLEEGMTFSNEPGLYVPDQGFGYNHSDVVLVTARRGLRLSSVPYTREWCFLTL